ncbi:MAG: hypothetical protein ACE5NW_15495 [Acidiferrobacterales bacterium]
MGIIVPSFMRSRPRNETVLIQPTFSVGTGAGCLPPKLPKACFPEGANRLDLLRWAFIEWATNNTDKHDWPAAQGLIAAVNAEMKCP